MGIFYGFDGEGTVTFVGDADPKRKQVMPAGTSKEDVEAAQVAFFANEPFTGTMPKLSPVQLAEGLRAEDVITSVDEAREFAAAGVIPPALLAMLQAIPDEATRDRAIVRTAGATEYEFDNPITQYVGEHVGQQLGWSADDFRKKWLTWSTF